MSDDPDLEILASELRTTRDIMHEWNSVIDLLNSGDLKKIVVTKSGKPSVVMISLEEALKHQENKKQADS